RPLRWFVQYSMYSITASISPASLRSWGVLKPSWSSRSIASLLLCASSSVRSLTLYRKTDRFLLTASFGSSCLSDPAAAFLGFWKSPSPLSSFSAFSLSKDALGIRSEERRVWREDGQRVQHDEHQEK